MKCNEVENRILDYLEGRLSPEESTRFASHIAECPKCRSALDQSNSLLETMNKIPPETPDKELQYAFEQMLQTEKQRQSKKKTGRVVSLSWKTAFQIAASLLLLIAGYLFGEYQGNKKAHIQISYLEKQSQELRTEMTLAMLENRSASKRIQAVGFSEEIQSPDNKVLRAIISRLHHDENINVRLTAAEALSRFKDNTLVKNAFIQVLETETNPDVQIAVIQFLTATQEKRAIKPMQKLLNKPDVPVYVKKQVNYGLTQIL